MELTLDDLESFALEQDVVVDDALIKGVAELALLQIRLEDDIERAEEGVKRLKSRLRNVAESLLPAAMTEAGVATVTLANGAVLKRSPFYSAHISEERSVAAFAWLREHGFSDIIKNQLTADIKAGQDNMVGHVADELAQLGISYTQKSAVHAATLKAFIKEQYEAGNPPPAEVFGTFVGEKVTIKRPKVSLDT
jgi:hypothetical protein